MKLQSYAYGEWLTGDDGHVPLFNAINGSQVAEISSKGLNFSDMLDYGRNVGGPALKALTFHERAIKLKELAKYLLEQKEAFYSLSKATGATRVDSWIDIEGGIQTLFTYSGKGRREMPNDHVYIDGQPEQISANGTFIGQHICIPLEGVAIHINAYNFPCWGMLEKIAPSLLAGMPVIVKPASNTAFLTELMFHKIIESGVFPEGSLQLICGSVGNLFDHLTCQDVVTFTGSASTGMKLKQHPVIMENSVRFNMEADSLNCSILGLDAKPGTEEFELYVKEICREMTVKAGQKCTAIRRIIAPETYVEELSNALKQRLSKVVVGDPDIEGVKMGALASLDQREEVRERVNDLLLSCEMLHGNLDDNNFEGVGLEKGSFLSPVLLHCADPINHQAVHDIEAFGPVSTIVPYRSTEEAIELAQRGKGSLVGSIMTYDNDIARELVLGCGTYHGRMVLINRDCAKESTGHGSPLPHLTHGGPGRAGGGEEMGGIRAVLHYMQRIALQGSPTTLSHICHKWLPGAKKHESKTHLFRKSFEDLAIGDSLTTQPRLITLDDIERFAELSGDKFYAHMDQEAASANPFFEGRVAHGYFLVSAAAGLFVDAAPGPVLANYGLDDLRFTQPVYPGDEMRVEFTCKQKINRLGEDYGEVRWNVDLINQNDEVAANYDVLTLVANKEKG